MKGCTITLLALVAVLILGTLGGCVYLYADTAQSKVHTGVGTVTDLHHRCARTRFVRTGTSMSPIRHSAKWEATIQVGGKQDTVRIKEAQFDRLSIGDEVNVAYKLGVYSDSLYIITIKP